MNTLSIPNQFADLHFLIFSDGEEKGPFSPSDLREELKKGRLKKATPCRPRSDNEWHDLAYILKSLEEIDETDDPDPLRVPPSWPRNASGSGRETKRAPASGRPSGILKRRDEDSSQELMAALIETQRGQNRQLAAIKWTLIVATAAIWGGIALFFGLPAMG